MTGTLAGNQPLELQVPRLLDALPLLDDENGIFTLPLAVQAQPLRFELHAWDGYEDDYRMLVESGYTNLQVACQAVRDAIPIGDTVIVAMVAEPERFRAELELPAPSPLRDREFDIAYDLWIVDVENVVRSSSTQVYYDRTAPGENAPFTFSGPSLIDREHLDANDGSATLELQRWTDLRLEDQVLVFFRPTDGALPTVPTAVITITETNHLLPSIPLLIAEQLLVSGSFHVSCQLRDRAGNVNRASNVLSITVDLSAGGALLLPIERIVPDFVNLNGWINCKSLERSLLDPWPDPDIPRGILFRVPLPQDGVSAGDPVQIIWQMCSDLSGRVPISKPSFLPSKPSLLRADGLVVMSAIDELIVEEFRKAFGPEGKPFEGSVNVAYRIQTPAGRWRTSELDSLYVSLQKSSGVCSGPWLTKQVQFPQNRSLIMGAYEGAGTNGPSELSAEDERQLELKSKAALKAERDNILEKRTSKPTFIGKVKNEGMGIFADLLADEFTFKDTLPNNAVVRPNEIPIRALTDEDEKGEDNSNHFITILVPKWAETGGKDYTSSSDQVRLIFNGIPWRYAGEEGEPEDDPDEELRRGEPFSLAHGDLEKVEFPVSVQITPKMFESLGEGIHRIAYEVINDQALNSDRSLPQRFTLDRVPPSFGVPPGALLTPTVPPPVEAGRPVFSKEYLDANATVIFPIPAYTVSRAGDLIRVLNGSNEAEVVRYTVIWPEADPVAPVRQISVPAEELRRLGNGNHQLVYILADRAGNPSGKSIGYNFTVRLEELPSALLAPEINNPDGTPKIDPIVRADLSATDETKVVDIVIPAYTGSQPTDLIEVTWTDGTGTPHLITPFPFSAGKVSVGWAFLSIPDSRALYTASVTYRVLRNGQPFGPSPAASPRVDLRIVGPVNPDEPEPVNPNLNTLTVVGGSGKSPDNFITPQDRVDEGGTIRVLDGTIKFTVYQGAEAGHVVTIFYGGQQVTTLTLGAELPGQVIEFNLPGAIIQAQGNDVVLAYYTIKETAASSNFQQSRNTRVTVSVITVLMRNFVWFNYAQGVPLARQNKRPGLITGATNLTGVLNCNASPWAGINLLLRDFRTGDPELGEEAVNPPVSVNIQPGDFLTVYWEYHPGTSTGVQDPSLPPVPPAIEHVLREVEVPPEFNPAAGFAYSIPYTNELFGQTKNPPDAAADSIVCRFSIRRGVNSWISRRCLVKYNTKQNGLCSGWVAR